ncbi:MAG TPA: hypothetical protein VFU49_24725 [Ktedonobacteraceae bacterium]|nr:hypothetical protein [Ktedonobacteraceae bacterium]
MNAVTTYDKNGQWLCLCHRRNLLTTKGSSGSLYGIFDDLQCAERAIEELQCAGYDVGNIHLIESQQLSVNGCQLRNYFFPLSGNSMFCDIYLQAAQRGYHILTVDLLRAEQVEHVRNLLAPYHARLIKYVGYAENS